MEKDRLARVGQRPTTQFDPLISLIRQCLEAMSNTQIRLSSARKELLIERERVRTAGSGVQRKRVDAGNAEAQFMNRLREFVNNYPGELPTTILDAYDKVGQTRDDLGEAEENYLQAEEDFTGAEWTFMNRENRFYQFDINKILLDPHFNDPASIYGQPFESPSHPPIFHLPPCPAGSLSPSQVSKLPPPPPPPPPPPLSPPPFLPTPRVLTTPSSSAPIGRGNADMMAEMDTLRREFGQLSQKKAYNFEWAREDEVFHAEGDGILEADVTASTSEYSDILFEISTPQANPQQIKIEEMDSALGASTLTRRYSDSKYSFRAASRFSAPMRRTQTESAALFDRRSPVTKKKIQEWSLTHLKESAVQKCLYLNTLEDNGIDSPVEDDWKVRATHFWSKDSLNESGDSNELYTASVSKISYEPQSCNDLSVTQSITSSLLMQHQLEGNLPPSKVITAGLRTRGSHEMLPQGYEDASPIAPLSPSPSPHNHIADKVEINNGNQTVNPVVGVLDEQQHVAEDDILADTGVNQPTCTCPAEFGDAAQRKDSVQSTKMSHHPDCAMVRKHDHEVKAYCSAQERNDLEMPMKVTTLDEHCDQTHQHQTVDLHLPLPSSSDHGQSAYVKSDFGTLAQSAPSSFYARLPTPSAFVNKTRLQPLETSITPNPRPIPQRRRNTINWVRSLFPQFKNKRSKSSPSIGEYHPVAPV